MHTSGFRDVGSLCIGQWQNFQSHSWTSKIRQSVQISHQTCSHCQPNNISTEYFVVDEHQSHTALIPFSDHVVLAKWLSVGQWHRLFRAKTAGVGRDNGGESSYRNKQWESKATKSFWWDWTRHHWSMGGPWSGQPAKSKIPAQWQIFRFKMLTVKTTKLVDSHHVFLVRRW